MSYTDLRIKAFFDFESAVELLRKYVREQRPQSFAMNWNNFICRYKLAKYYSYRGYISSVRDLFEYAQKEKIERFGSEIASTSYF